MLAEVAQMIYVGIDPGKQGAVAEMGNDDIFVWGQAEPVRDLIQLQIEVDCRMNKALVVIEKMTPYAPSKTAIGSIMYQFGEIVGACKALKLPYIIVRPQEWKKEILKGMDWKKNKRCSVDYVLARYPELSLRRTDRCKKDDDNMADAVCLAEYGRRVG
jgi:hypothetical protein